MLSNSDQSSERQDLWAGLDSWLRLFRSCLNCILVFSFLKDYVKVVHEVVSRGSHCLAELLEIIFYQEQHQAHSFEQTLRLIFPSGLAFTKRLLAKQFNLMQV